MVLTGSAPACRRGADRTARTDPAPDLGRRWPRSSAGRYPGPALEHLIVLTAAGILTGAGQLLLDPSAEGQRHRNHRRDLVPGRPPAKIRTLASATLSVADRRDGRRAGPRGCAETGRGGGRHALSDRVRLSDDQTPVAGRLWCRCRAWPRPTVYPSAARCLAAGGAARRARSALVLPAPGDRRRRDRRVLGFLPDHRHTGFPEFHRSVSCYHGRLIAGPIIGLVSSSYVRSVAWADRHKPTGLAPIARRPSSSWRSSAWLRPRSQLLGNGRDVAELAVQPAGSPPAAAGADGLAPNGDGDVPGQRRTGRPVHPFAGYGCDVGGVLGVPWVWLFPGVPLGLLAFLGAGAMLAASTQGPISTVVLMMELTGYARAAIVPMLLDCGNRRP